MVETLVAVAILGVFLTVFWSVWTTTPRQTRTVETGTELTHAASLLTEALVSDLMRAPPLAAAPVAAAGSLSVPRLTAYEPAQAQPMVAQQVRYRHDAARQTIARDGKVLVAGGVTAADFRWSTQAPWRLTVKLTGVVASGGPAPTVSFELAMPENAAPPGWRFAAHHRAARLRE